MARKQRPQSARAGAVPSVIVNGALLYVANAWPGWWAVPILTPAMSQVIGAFNAVWTAGIVANMVYLLVGVRAIRALGEIVVIIFGLVALFRLWDVFPFDFAGSSIDWVLVARSVIVIAIVGSFVGIIAQLVALVRSALPSARR